MAIREKLYTDREYFDNKFDSIDQKLSEFNLHLKELNGSVARHEKIINQNLPHNIAHCPQTETIEDLKKNMVTERAVKKTIYIGFGIICGLMTLIWTITEIIK